MVMRVGGIVSGMDIEAMVNKLMEAERQPLNRLKQQQTLLTWKRDAYREVNSKLLDLKNMMLDMKLSKTYNPKTATSSQKNAVSATASSNASNGVYEISVTQMATSAMRVGGEVDLQLDSVMTADQAGTFAFQTYDKNGNAVDHSFTVNEGDTLKQVLKNIESSSAGNLRAFFDESGSRIVLEATRTGSYNANGDEITFSGNTFFENTLNLTANVEIGGENATFTYNNGLEIETRDNTYTMNGITYEFHNVTDGNARISISTDVEQSFDAIMNFVNKYNEVIEAMNKTQTEEKFRQFSPLTDEQKEEMTEEQIKKWEEKAKSGILRGETSIQNGMYELRRSMQSKVETGGEYTLLSHIGITTTMNYLDGGKLEVNEEKLKAALSDHPDDVYKLFSNNAEGAERGLINRFDETLENTRSRIERQAGKATHTLDNYALGKQMKEINERISDYEKKMIRIEQRYWNQFTQMEKAIANLSQQSSYLFSQFGGGM